MACPSARQSPRTWRGPTPLALVWDEAVKISGADSDFHRRDLWAIRERMIAPRLGRVKPANRDPVEATGTLENSAPVLFDGRVLPDGVDGVKVLGRRIEGMDFISNQYRYGKTILALGACRALLERGGVQPTLAHGKPDPGVFVGTAAQVDRAAADFMTAPGRHRHPEREAATLAR